MYLCFKCRLNKIYVRVIKFYSVEIYISQVFHVAVLNPKTNPDVKPTEFYIAVFRPHKIQQCSTERL